MAAPLNLAMVFRAETAQAKAALNDMKSGMAQVSAEADRMGASARRQGDALGALGEGGRRAGDGQRKAGDGAREYTGHARGAAGATANLTAQFNDIGMMLAAGQSPLLLAVQQGTQVSQVLTQMGGGRAALAGIAAGFTSMLNPVSLATIGIIGFGAAGVQALVSMIPKTESLDDALSGLIERIDDYGAAMRRLRTTNFSAEFGSAAITAEGLSAEILQIQRRQAERAAASAVAAIGPDMMGSDWWGIRGQSALFENLTGMFGEGGSLDGARAGGKAPLALAVYDQIKAIEGLPSESDLATKIAALDALRLTLQKGRRGDGADTKAIDEHLQKLDEQLLKMRQLQAIDENAAGKNAARQMADELGRQVEMQSAIARFGKDSNEARAVELVQARQIAAEKLKAQGVDLRSDEGKRAIAAVESAFWARRSAEDAAHATEQEASLRRRDAQLAATQREIGLIGATAAERARVKALAEAELEIRERSLSVAEAEVVRTRAVAQAAAEAGLVRAQALRDLELARSTDAIDVQISSSRDAVTRAGLEAQREYIRLTAQGTDADIAAAQAARVRAAGVEQAIAAARGQVGQLADELQARQSVAAQVAAGTVPAAEANRLIQQELQLRPLLAAAAAAEGDEKRRLTEILTGLQTAQELLASEDRRQGQNTYLRGAAERVQQARLELALIGQTAAVRARVLALVQAERDIRAQGLTGAAAEEVRRNAEELLELNRQIEAQGDAWKRVQSAGEGAIDAVLDKLKGGDVKGAFAGLLDELNKGFFDLAIRNPLKNMLLGTNLGTIDDIGGMRGIWDRLTGKAPLDQAGLISSASSPVQAMTIAAAQVTINAAALGLGGPAAALLPGLGNAAANVNAAPMPAGLQTQAILAGVAVGGGARQGAIANLDRALADPLAAMVTEAQRLFGESAVKISSAYRSTERQAQLWQDALQKYGSAEAARKWVAPPGRSNHNHGLAADLSYGSPEVQRWMHANAASYGLTYRMANEPWHIEPIGGRGARQGRLGQDAVAAEQAIAALGTSAQAATQPIGQMGQTAQTTTGKMGEMGAGMEGFGGALQQILGAAVTGNKGGAIGGLVNLGLGLLTRGIPGFSGGGPTGGSDPSRVAGLVHEGEFVISAPAVRRIGVRNLDALHRGTLRGFAAGGYVSALAAPSGRDGGGAAGGSVTFAPSFDLRGANDPAEVERAARRGMAAALEDYDRMRLPGRMREVLGDQRVV